MSLRNENRRGARPGGFQKVASIGGDKSRAITTRIAQQAYRLALAAEARLHAYVDELDRIADWKEDLEARIEWAAERAAAGVPDAFAEIEIEVGAFESEVISLGEACERIVARLARQRRERGAS